MLRQLQPDIPRVQDVALTPTVLAFTAAIAIGAALLFSLAPVLDVRHPDLRSSLTGGGRGASSGPAAGRTRKILVACEVALACVLLVSGGLLLRSLQRLLDVDPGFRADHVVMFDLYLPSSRYPDAPRHTRFYRDLTNELALAPGVDSAGGLLYFPYKPKLWLTSLWIEGAPRPDGEEPIVYYNLASGDYFRTLGIPLRAGRWPTPQEMWEEPRVVLVNDALARQVFPDGSALGRRIRTDQNEPWREVVGIVGNVRQKGLDERPRPEIYSVFSEMPMPFLTVVAHTTREPATMLDVIRGVVRRRDAGLAVANLQTLPDYVRNHTSDRRFALVLLGMFAGLALLLGAVGVYGVLSYSVAERQRELAIRLALGAAPVGVRSMVVRDALQVVAMGTLVGLAGAIASGRLMSGMLFGVSSIDPLTFIAVPGALMIVALAASWIPARRASRVDAIEALRGE
jgi:predicted permease